MESRDTCLPVKDQEGQRNKVKVELSTHIPSLKRSVQRRLCLSPYAPAPALAPAGPLPEWGKGPPSVQLLSTSNPLPTAAAVLAPSISSNTEWKGGMRRGASGVSGWGNFGSCLRRSCLRLLREGAQGDVFPLALGEVVGCEWVFVCLGEPLFTEENRIGTSWQCYNFHE